MTQRLEIVERSREGEKTLTPAHNPVDAGVGEGPVHHWKDVWQKADTFLRKKVQEVKRMDG